MQKILIGTTCLSAVLLSSCTSKLDKAFEKEYDSYKMVMEMELLDITVKSTVEVTTIDGVEVVKTTMTGETGYSYKKNDKCYEISEISDEWSKVEVTCDEADEDIFDLTSDDFEKEKDEYILIEDSYSKVSKMFGFDEGSTLTGMKITLDGDDIDTMFLDLVIEDNVATMDVKLSDYNDITFTLPGGITL